MQQLLCATNGVSVPCALELLNGDEPTTALQHVLCDHHRRRLQLAIHGLQARLQRPPVPQLVNQRTRCGVGHGFHDALL